MTGAVLLFFLKLLPYGSSFVVKFIVELFSTLPPTPLPFGNNLALYDCCAFSFSYDILASLRLDILGTCLVSSIYPSALILIWNSSIHPILCSGSFVNILDIILFKTGEIVPGNARFCVLSTSIKLAIEFDWKGQCPNTISYSTTPRDHISALIEYISPLRTSGAI